MNFNMNLVLYLMLVVVIYLIDVHSSLFHDGSDRPDWNKRQNNIMSNEVEDEQSASGPEQVNEVHAGLRMGQRKGFKNEEKILIEECCPSFKEWIAPKGGVSRDGKILELFRNDNVSQRFLQISCKSDRRNKPCAFLSDHPVYGSFSRCVQQYTYSYAIVRAYDSDPDAPFKVDHIRMRSGCKCVVSKQFGNYDFAHRKPGMRYRPPPQQSGKGMDRTSPVVSRRSSSAGVAGRRTSPEEGVRSQQHIISNSSPILTSSLKHPHVGVSQVEDTDRMTYNEGDENIIFWRH